MISYHPDVEVRAGLPLVLNGTLLDGTGQPFDCTSATLTWALLDPDGSPAVPVNAVTITKTAPTSGGIQISVPKEAMALPVGRYTDCLSVQSGALKQNFWTALF
jgi:hypothetical protein